MFIIYFVQILHNSTIVQYKIRLDYLKIENKICFAI
jgi:hypothetical protein